MNEIQKFYNSMFGELRILETNDGRLLICGKDVASALGYKDTAHAISAHCKGVCEIPTPSNGGIQKMKFITEGDMYRLIAQSKLPDADRFETWVFDEVLPSIRKHGAYMTPDVLEQTIQNPDYMIGILNALKDEQTRRKELELIVTTQTNTIQEQQTDIDRMRPKEIFADAVADSDGTILIRDLAKLLKQNGVNTGEKKLYAWLRDNGYIIKYTTSPTQRAMEPGLFIIKETVSILPSGESHPNFTTKVTGKGQQYFLEKGLKLKVMDGER